MDSVPPQHIYATNLRQNVGYPLRIPRPNSKLGQPYLDEGFQVGDVGYIDKHGEFHVLFNIKITLSGSSGSGSTNASNQAFRFPEPPVRKAFDPDKMFMSGVTQLLGNEGIQNGYKFTATSKTGAILILPDGAIVSEVEEEHFERLRELVLKYALQWCRDAKRESLYLVTTVYRTKTWTLGSFYEGPGVILVHRTNPNGIISYKWEYQFNVDHDQGPGGNCSENQTVFIKGFKMTVRWDWLPVVQKLESTERRLTRIVATLRSILRSREWLFQKRIQDFPPQDLSQPHHALDIINRVLLDKNPKAGVAVAHDNDWIEIHEKKGLLLVDLMNEDTLRVILEKEYTCNSNSEHNVVYLRSNEGSTRDTRTLARDEADSETQPTSQPDEGANDKCDTRDIEDTQASSLPPSDNSRLVVTNIRLESFDVEPIDAGVCILLQSETMTRRTTNKSSAGIVEWDEEIVLPGDPQVNVTVCGVFQLGSTLGTREISTKHSIDTMNLTGSIHKYRILLGNTESHSSVLVTIGRQFSDFETYSSSHETSRFEEKTSLGFKALYAHHDEPEKGCLEDAVGHFKSALEECDPRSSDRATALFNLATTEFIKCQVDGKYSEFSKLIGLYREALGLLDSDHRDRPATLLLLAQAFLFLHGQRYDESIVGEIRPLLAEILHDGSRERQTADAIANICRFYETIKSEDLEKLDELFKDLERCAYVPPYGYFDCPHVLHTLGAALWHRFQRQGNLDDLDKSIQLNEEALRLIPDGHQNHADVVNCLGNSYLRHIQALGDLKDVDMSVGLTQLGEMVVAKLDDLSSREGLVVPSETLRGQIERISASEAAVRSLRSLGPSGRIPQIRIPVEGWSKEDGVPMKCTRQLGVLLSFLGGEGEIKMRELLGNLKWPFKECMVKDTTHFLEEHVPYFDSIVAVKLRCLMGGWCVTENIH